MTAHLSNSYLYRETKAVTGEEAAVTHPLGKEYLTFCGLDNIHALSVFGHDYGVVLFLS